MFKFKNYFLTVSGLIIGIIPKTVFAVEPVGDVINSGLVSTAFDAGYNFQSNPPFISLVGFYIQYALSFLGVLFLLLIIYGGFLWMQARGSDEDAKKAKEVIINAIIGLIVILSGYVISNSIITFLIESHGW